MNNFSILTLFPEFFNAFLNCSILNKAIDKKIITANIINIRDFAENKHKQVDDYPYGGGAGMLIMAQPILSALDYAKKKHKEKTKVIFLSPQGELFDNKKAKELSLEKDLIFICGHYEGIDERVMAFVDEEISVGNFILTGGELACMIVIDSTIRFITGVLGNEESAKKDSLSSSLLKHSQYTKPSNYKNMNVPEILMSGHHKNIEEWQLKDSLKKTFLKRPDILENKIFTSKEKEILYEWIDELKRLREK